MEFEMPTRSGRDEWVKNAVDSLYQLDALEEAYDLEDAQDLDRAQDALAAAHGVRLNAFAVFQALLRLKITHLLILQIQLIQTVHHSSIKIHLVYVKI
jgi:hypothetical protein